MAGGPLGSGKSFLIARVVAALQELGAEPLVIRGSAALRRTALGALEVAPDPRAPALADGVAGTGPLVLIVDDAQELDAASLATVVRAVHTHHATGLIAVTEPRLPTAPRNDVIEVIDDLWISGSADRWELPALCPREAERLLEEFAADDPFDSVTRAGILWAADGSRLLLRALVDAARAEIAAGRDPLTIVSEGSTRGSLAAVLHAHVRELEDDQLGALVLLERAPGLRYADAARLVPASVLDDLRSTGLLHDDGSTGHRLSVNRALARAAERVWGRERSRNAVGEMLDRMLRDGGRWWSRPLARQLADRWVREVAHPSDLNEVAAPLMQRVILDAARDANDHGDAAHAAAYAAWLDDEHDTPAITLEHRFAQVVLGSGRPGTSLLDLDPEDHHRARSLVMLLEIDDRDDRLDGARAIGVRVDDATDWERAVGRARAALDDLRLRDAVVLAEHVRRHPDTNRVSDRVGAELLEAMSRAYLGETTAMHEALGRSHRLFRTGSFEDALDRLAARCFHLACHTVAGTDDAGAVSHLATERESAIRSGGGGVAGASFAAVLVEVRRGRVLPALRELRAARRRADFAGGEAVGLIELETAYGLAAFGYPREAAELLSSVEQRGTGSRVFRQSFAATSAVVAATNGALSEAHMHAADAWAVSSETDAVMLQLRDLHRLVVLDHPCAASSLILMRELAADVEAPTARDLVRAAEEAFSEREREGWRADRALARLRLSLVPHGTRPATSTTTSVPAVSVELTAREREIALLVEDGLSNRQIAGALFLSVRTVESHIYQARAKVGAPSRRELGALVARHGAHRAPTVPPAGDESPPPANGHPSVSARA
ncbi:LuxR C-terminal-related transcriptional regulator [Microbacterium radiodurans]|uniref:HTH luxR-type domain-containing protein n=1 Tax=Microbacterium radiodurans TaxID=661398 RepID=A0A5J5ISJ4_9MICO|nr:LuxR C-terminal-related transcriptional regulator [Microbacterium radiodurans]KAA9087270.1 hypothetical protein F6B42_10010 [Microbacterium radiodurans]